MAGSFSTRLANQGGLPIGREAAEHAVSRNGGLGRLAAKREVDIVALWLVILATTIGFWRVSLPAGALLLPYLCGRRAPRLRHGVRRLPREQLKARIVMSCLVVASMFYIALMQAPVGAQGGELPHIADPDLAKQLGADDRGMRNYVLVILKTGPHRVPDGPVRDEMFEGHFANIKRLAAERQLVVAGPFGDENEWRGMFIFAVETPEEAASLVATDPVIKSGEMVAEYHRLYASAALMSVAAIHEKIAPQ
jgi:uncharacterized protein YciI